MLPERNPSRSSATMSDSPSVPGMQNDALFGSRCVGCPFRTASGTRTRTPAMRWSRSFACRGDSVARRSRAMRIASAVTACMSATGCQKRVIPRISQALWDLHLRVSPTTRSLAECGKLYRDNLEFNISLLDCRYICGDVGLFEQLRSQVIPKMVAREALERGIKAVRRGAAYLARRFAAEGALLRW